MHEWTPGLFEPTGLLISRDRTLLQEIAQVRGTVHKLRWEDYETLDQAGEAVILGGVALIVVHLTAAADETELARWLARAATRPPCAVIVLSDVYRERQAAVLLRAGVADYLERPVDGGKLARLLDVLVSRACSAPRPAGPAVPDAVEPCGFRSLCLGPDMLEVLDQLRRVAAQETTLLLTGDTGTGKSHLARLVHELSPRRDEPFLVVDCGALSVTLIESELFGHLKGAFTGADRDRVGKLAAAGAGTLLLDEINALPVALQAKLLRAVDERVFEPVGADAGQPIRARLIVTSNRPLEAEVGAGRFRADLYYRLNVISVSLPPLRERRAAVAPLARRFLAEFAGRNRLDLGELTPEAVHALERYDWPGNIRELRNVIERAAALCPGPDVLLSDLPEAVRGPAPRIVAMRRPDGRGACAAGTLAQSKERAEVFRITEALRRHGNNRVRAAAELGISRMSLYKKLHKYGLLCAAQAH